MKVTKCKIGGHYMPNKRGIASGLRTHVLVLRQVLEMEGGIGGEFACDDWTRQILISYVKPTPCTKLGYMLGDDFTVKYTGGQYVEIGEELVLAKDDGTDYPYFKAKHPKDYVGQFMRLENVTKKPEVAPAEAFTCSSLGYAIGGQFVVKAIRDTATDFKVGTRLVLIAEDGGKRVLFSSLEDETLGYMDIDLVAKVQPQATHTVSEQEALEQSLWDGWEALLKSTCGTDIKEKRR